MSNLAAYLTSLPLIAILRGIQTHECLDIAQDLYAAGFRCIEIPLNSPDALQSIALLVQSMPTDCLIGAGTVLHVQQVRALTQVGARLVVMPHSDSLVIRAAKQSGLFCIAGVTTINEAFAAINLEADALKLFPAESVSPSVLKAWRTVLPPEAICLPVGGVTPEGMQTYMAAGANGFGLGSNLYQAGMSAAQVKLKATTFVQTMRQLSVSTSA
jgi:2-dehydro-3-deoxyphosphogalactonate aldolase